ncbi:FecR family protein [Pontibacter sp. SGAir0037]|uniref:FecR family protein n=1 Tax=Pontibacter sp. SGAir0037 TaxID=2571030 RepID=UPI00143DF68D|nr:FecR domain-containing protein [Pontibacter sp. SGAir0037]
MNDNYKNADELLANELFVKWLQHPDADTNAYWESWLSRHPEQRGAVEEAKRILQHVAFDDWSLSEEDSQLMLQNILANKNPAVTPPAKQEAKIHHLSNWLSGWNMAAAAAVVLLLLAGVGFYLLSNQQKTLQYATAYGEIKTILLPDSSEVVLNANSKLKWNENWDGTTDRQVWLEGEGFFSVLKKRRATAKEGDVKFTVHTQNMDVEVLGTEFNVKERPSETRVVLNSGKVRLSINALKKEEPVYMEPGESVKLNKNSIEKTLVKAGDFSAWQKRKLVLNNTTVADVANILNDIYGVQVIFRNPLTANRVLNGTLPTNDQAALLNALATTLGVEIQVEGRQVIVHE